MSILHDVLVEEYDRCIRQKKIWKDALKDLSRKEHFQSYRKALRRTKKDLRMLRRALGPLVYFKWRKWQKAETVFKLKMMQERQEE